MRSIFRRPLVLGLFAVLAGCHGTPAPVANPAPLVAGEYSARYQAAIDTLRDHGFQIDRQDHRFGRITTEPLDSPTLFEPWRRHNSTAGQTFASTFGHLQRRALVFFDPVTDIENAYTLRVEVQLTRQQEPLRRLNGTATRGRIDRLKAVPTEWADRGIAAAYDEPISRDAEYEQRLLADILSR